VQQTATRLHFSVAPFSSGATERDHHTPAWAAAAPSYRAQWTIGGARGDAEVLLQCNGADVDGGSATPALHCFDTSAQRAWIESFPVAELGTPEVKTDDEGDCCLAFVWKQPAEVRAAYCRPCCPTL
jgi:hypothetical protein